MTDLVVSRDRLYRLLPALYRLRDAAVGEPLRALLAIMEAELSAFEEDVAGLYESFFIETCPEWVIPYIADLLDVRGLPPSKFLSARSYVAHTVGYRRRKGTLSMLPELARDVTDFPVHVVESFPLLSRTQHLSNPRLQNVRTPLLRKRDSLSLVGGPFDTVQHTLDVRRKYHPKKIGVYIWRTRSLRVTGQEAVPYPGQDQKTANTLLFTCSPSGAAIPLYSPGGAATASANPASREASYPGPLRPQSIAAELAAWERAALQGKALDRPVYFGALPALRVVIEQTNAARTEIRPADMVAAAITSGSFTMPARSTTPYQAAIDVMRGIVAIPRSLLPAGTRVLVDYSFGIVAEIGGGYAHPKSPLYKAAASLEIVSLRGGESRAQGSVIADALVRLNLQDSATPRYIIVQLEDSRSYGLPQSVSLGRNIKLELRAADGQRPVLFSQTPNAPVTFLLDEGTELSLDGLFVSCPLYFGVELGSHAHVDLHHVTAGEMTGAIHLNEDGATDAFSQSLAITARRSVMGLVAEVDGLGITADFEDCYISRIYLLTSAVSLRGCTVGDCTVRELTLVIDSLFQGKVLATSADGTIRYSYLPPNSTAPPGYNCQPDLASRDGGDPAACVPVFSAADGAAPGRFRLADVAHLGLRTGASDSGELGVMHHVGAQQRETALREALDDFLRINLEAEIYYVT